MSGVQRASAPSGFRLQLHQMRRAFGASAQAPEPKMLADLPILPSGGHDADASGNGLREASGRLGGRRRRHDGHRRRHWRDHRGRLGWLLVGRRLAHHRDLGTMAGRPHARRDVLRRAFRHGHMRPGGRALLGGLSRRRHGWHGRRGSRNLALQGAQQHAGWIGRVVAGENASGAATDKKRRSEQRCPQQESNPFHFRLPAAQSFQ